MHNITGIDGVFTKLHVARKRSQINSLHSIEFQFGGYCGRDFLFVTIGDMSAKVTGEDLYAFRELLNELPEEAFVRPADPEPDSPRWTDGDIVRHPRRDDLTYIRRQGEWDRHVVVNGSASVGYLDSDDCDISMFVDELGYRVIYQANA